MEIGLYFLLAHALLGDISKKAFFRLVPVNLGKCFILPILRHKGAEKGDDLSHQLSGDLRQSRGKPGSDLREIHHILFGGDKLALLHLAKLIDPAVVGGDQADDLIRGASLFQGAEFPLISGIPLGFHFHLRLYIAARVFVLRFLEGVEKFAGAFDHLLHGNDCGTLGVFDLLADTAVFHTPGYPFAFLQIGKIIGLADAQFLKGHGRIVDLLFHALVVKYRRLFQQAFLGILRCFLLKGRGNGILRRRLGWCLGRPIADGCGCRLGCCSNCRCDFRHHRCRRRRNALYCCRRRKWVSLRCSAAVSKNCADVQSFFFGDLLKGPRAVSGFTHSKLLLSILGQKKTAITPMSNYGFILVLITFQVV